MSNDRSSYRWIILLAIVPIIVSTEMMWLSLAPIASLAEQYYEVGSLSIAWFSLSYMVMFIAFSLPASWVIDRWGYRVSLTIGAAITAVFGLLRALYAHDYTIVLIMQFIIAIGQPFLLNITTKVAARWFPISERSTAAGILTMAQYAGFVIPMALAPMIAEQSGIPALFMAFAIAAIASAVIAILFTADKRQQPYTAPPAVSAPGETIRMDAVRSLLRNNRYMFILLISFISIGIFNTLLTLLEAILAPRGITSAQAGIVGAAFVIAGIIGAVLLPILSDKYASRRPFFVGAIGILLPSLIGLTFVNGLLPLSVIAAIAGFAIMGVAPILFQQGSESAYPVPEGASLGIILLMGQVSGAAFVYLFETAADKLDSIVWPMLAFALMAAAMLPLACRIRDSHARAAEGSETTLPRSG